MPEIGKEKRRNVKAVVVDFDQTLADTRTIMPTLRKGGLKANEIKELLKNAYLYNGWHEVINYLKANKIALGIVSHNTQSVIKEAIKHFGIKPDFVITRYGKHFVYPNMVIISKKGLLEQALEEPSLRGAKKEQILYLGDQASDVQEAKAFGCLSGGCFYGTEEPKELLNSHPDVRVFRPTDILKLL